MTKQELRRRSLEARGSLPPAEVEQRSRDIGERFFDNFNLDEVRSVHVFITIQKFKEVDTSFVIQKLRREFPLVRTIAPRVDHASGKIEHVAFDGSTQFALNRWGISEPADGDVIEPEQIDIVLVPGLAFDKGGHRVGYGRGFYDRFLNRTRPDCLKIGLSYFPPVDRIDDVHAGDATLEHCVTPDCVYTLRSKPILS
ncbi:MAG TPA: 5-formyltetrahydrofolate cyclo-ligase [Pyrinomonadaceae bacterium]|nr:5-formyltetrahydrofolate cyclo-ligase [Pyrinomonadaceae bacterium]